MTTHHDNDHDDFSNVTWSDHVHDQAQRSAAAAAAEAPARAVEEAGNSSTQGIGREKLECTVGSPIKENDGTKDAFVSYLVTTHVCCLHHVQQPKAYLATLPLSVSLSLFMCLTYPILPWPLPRPSSSRCCRKHLQTATTYLS